jgi:acetoin utilization protein AcuB
MIDPTLVGAVMTRTVVTIEPGRSPRSALLLMRTHRFRHLPVVAGGYLVGIVSDRDVTGHEFRSVGDAMRRDVISVTTDTPVETAARLMLDNKIGALPVVGTNAGELIGIVSESDLLRALARLLEGEIPNTRILLYLDDLPGQLAQAVRLAHERHVPIMSLVTLPGDSDHAARAVILRIGTIQAKPFIAALHEAGIRANPAP